MNNWNGFESVIFGFDGKTATVIFPKNKRADRKWFLKTEYLDAFPSYEIEMLNRGYTIAHIENETRWCLESDTERQAMFAVHIIKKYGLYKKCGLIGMSCGGMQAVYFAAKHPELSAFAYLDAPVLNLLSCPCGVGHSTNEMYIEFVNATGFTVSDIINYRKHPIDYVPILAENKFPIFLACGDSDNVVPYRENGDVLRRIYKKCGAPIKVVVREGCGHHPHGLFDYKPLLDFTERYYGE